MIYRFMRPDSRNPKIHVQRALHRTTVCGKNIGRWWQLYDTGVEGLFTRKTTLNRETARTFATCLACQRLLS